MRILGTAGPAGWPEAGCGCVSCERLRSAGEHRSPTRVVLRDGRELPPGGSAPGVLHASPDPVPYGGAGPYDVVVFDVSRPETLGRLRRDGLAGDATDVIAVGLDHRLPSMAELERRLRFWGARAVPDGTEPAGEVPARPAPPRRTLILGGSRSGKSAEAELRLLAEPYVTYVATGPAAGDDPGWRARVAAHVERRPAHWETVETTDPVPLLREATGCLLIDGIGTWLAAVHDECDGWNGGDVTPRVEEFVEAWRRTRARVVAVSDEAGMGVVPATASGRLFRDALGRLNQRLAAESEEAALVVAGRVVAL
ncbi:bifunctional adenosylcobinamide kinase/adenosylcobinamide-phosphate guanylyltransferase [Bailinhaonella thermotolerans]|uniref:bifunctional adenosylcobinamide kinase/adenosylcobinamide-phosphate guanylyltransferase n=1 Tax=Bailinhaonella thermotolerans TaxID=1070861 RepID=UPI001F5B1309|nr:bifunctional adenosylcobinamide kinase/adenosylcobinamide-phosphate guanylyltransferase [Bailinhaonella thermotolerans]